MSQVHKSYIEQAIDMATDNVRSGRGGPFGALIVLDGEVIGRGVNRVTSSNDPTAHAEVAAIRDACQRLGTFKLEGATIYTSCEPCPMCLSAIYWARISRICYAADNTDAARAGFDDSFIYEQVRLPSQQRAILSSRIDCGHAARPFEAWLEMEGRIEY
jgi:guanine deaminase